MKLTSKQSDIKDISLASEATTPVMPTQSPPVTPTPTPTAPPKTQPTPTLTPAPTDHADTYDHAYTHADTSTWPHRCPNQMVVGGRSSRSYRSGNPNHVFRIQTTQCYCFISDIQTIRAGVVSGPMTLQAQDLHGDPYNVIGDTTIDLKTNSISGKFDISPGPFDGSITSVTIPDKSSKADFYYKDNSPGQVTIITAKNPRRGWEKAVQKLLPG